MAHEVVWTKRVESFFADAANLTQFERDILHSRICGMTRLEQSFFYTCSLSTIDKTIKKLKRVYDIVQREYPDELPIRRNSEAEKYLDEH